MKKIIAVNGSPRKGWNTSELITEAAKGAESKGAEVKIFDLYALEKFTGCISCFGCKLSPNEGVCVYKDGLAKVLAPDAVALGGMIVPAASMGVFGLIVAMVVMSCAIGSAAATAAV